MQSPKFHLSPFCDGWLEYGKPEFIKEKILEICQNISKKGEKSSHSEIFDMLYEYIEDNINKFISEVDYE